MNAEVAYLPGPYWAASDSDAVKSLLLFFDGIALLTPHVLRRRVFDLDPALAEPLADRDMLHRLDPAEVVTGSVSSRLNSLFPDDLLEQIKRSRSSTPRSPIAVVKTSAGPTRRNRLRGDAMPADLLTRLRSAGLAGKPGGTWVAVNRDIRDHILAAIPLLVRDDMALRGLQLHPVASRANAQHALEYEANLRRVTAASVVLSDLARVRINLSAVPLDDVLAFRDEHGPKFRAYARDLREHLSDLGRLEGRAASKQVEDRREALEDAARELDRVSRSEWGRTTGAFGLGIAGCVTALKMGNPAGAAIALTAAALGVRPPKVPPTPYAYILEARHL